MGQAEQDTVDKSEISAQARANGETERLLESARDAISDDIVSRVAATASEGLDLLDRVNRSGVAEALPALSELAENGDLERLVHLARLLGSVQDALSDDIIARLGETAAGGLDLLDRLNRSDVVDALPAISALVRNGDLDRLVQLARVLGSAQDALSDDIIARLAAVFSDGLGLVDQLTRRGTLDRILDLLEQPGTEKLLTNLTQALDETEQEAKHISDSKGGLTGIIKLLSSGEVQDSIRYVALVIKNFHKHWSQT